MTPLANVPFRNTKPELHAQEILNKAGVQFRTHATELPGEPDIAVDSTRTAIFVHGCFFHGHGCKNDSPPKPDSDLAEQIRLKKVRDARNPGRLAELGWRTCIVWECELKDTPLKTARRMAAEIGIENGLLCKGYSTGEPIMKAPYRTPIGLWALFGILLLVVATGTFTNVMSLQELSKNNAAVEAKKDQLNSLNADIELRRADLEQAKANLQSATTRLAPIKAQVMTQRTQQEKLHREWGTMQSDLAGGKQTLTDLVSEAKTARVQLDTLKSEINAETWKAEQAKTKSMTLKGTVEVQERELESIASQISNDRATQDELLEQINTLRKNLRKAQDDTDLAANQLAAIQRREVAAQQTIDLAQELMDSSQKRQEDSRAIESELRQLREQLAAERTRLTTATQALAAADAGRIGFQHDERAAKSELRALQSEIDGLISKRGSIESSTLIKKNALAQLNEQLSTANSALDAAAAKRASSERKLDTANQAETRARAEQLQLATDNEVLTKVIEDKRGQLKELEKAIANAHMTTNSQRLNTALADQLRLLNETFSQLIARLQAAAAPPPSPPANATQGESE